MQLIYFARCVIFQPTDNFNDAKKSNYLVYFLLLYMHESLIYTCKKVAFLKYFKYTNNALALLILKTMELDTFDEYLSYNILFLHVIY